jgi:hypothetical protein
VQTDGHEIRTTSASPWSLTVDIGRTEQHASRMTLTALAQGGSGDYQYNWASYSLTEFDNGIRELGGGSRTQVRSDDGRAVASSIEVPNGHFIAMVNVRDRKTGAFRHHQQQVFSSAFGDRPPSAPLVA